MGAMQTTPITGTGLVSNKGKGILGGSSPGFPANEHLVVPLMWWSKLEQYFEAEGKEGIRLAPILYAKVRRPAPIDLGVVESIVLGPSKKGLIVSGGASPLKPLFPSPNVHHGIGVSLTIGVHEE
ncbi:hypothetical protein J1N35_010590 [Gossypium stocksii]|uniref:Uncharacterized protein n=1 Tax=Gossypium stocksii TaxID=47602 RepID=A0A9D3W1B3_9ROSI|nr:hypothetical protein J1N35_010590 [Gossypium stocksii]